MIYRATLERKNCNICKGHRLTVYKLVSDNKSMKDWNNCIVDRDGAGDGGEQILNWSVNAARYRDVLRHFVVPSMCRHLRRHSEIYGA